jgi:preprotein translocase subunit SecG
MIAVPIFIVALFILLGIILSMGKGANLIAGYNTASEADKAKIDEKKLCKYVGRLMFVLASCMSLLVLSFLLKSKALEWIGLGLFLVSIAIGLIWINTGGRILKEDAKTALRPTESDLEETVRRAEDEYHKNHPEK